MDSAYPISSHQHTKLGNTQIIIYLKVVKINIGSKLQINDHDTVKITQFILLPSEVSWNWIFLFFPFLAKLRTVDSNNSHTMFFSL